MLPNVERLVSALEEIADKLGAIRTQMEITNDQLRAIRESTDKMAATGR